MRNENYYHKLAAARLQRVYELATPRIRRYLDAEIFEVAAHISDKAEVLELGCGYGRVLKRLAVRTSNLFGIDTSVASLGQVLRVCDPCVAVASMRAGRLALKDGIFDLVFAIQNGISAFKEDPRQLLKESIRVLRSKGTLLLSSYSPKIWAERLIWFERQAAEGLIGEIDRHQTRDGRIVCKDGFTADTMTPTQFEQLAHEVRASGRVYEVDDSSIFLKIIKP